MKRKYVQCDLVLENYMDLQGYIKRDHSKKFHCTLCDYETQERKRLMQHVKQEHEVNTCQQCDFVTENHKELKKHLESTHSRKSKLQCEQCDFETEERKRLTQHVKCKH